MTDETARNEILAMEQNERFQAAVQGHLPEANEAAQESLSKKKKLVMTDTWKNDARTVANEVGWWIC